MERKIAACFALLFGLVNSASSVSAEPTRVSLATATKGGGFELYGRVAAQVINELQPKLHVVPENTKGSVDNISLLADGKFDLALVQGVAAYEALAGIGQKPTKPKIIAAVYSSPGMFVVRSDQPAWSVVDLVGNPIAWGTKTSGLTLMARYVMEGLGLDRDNDFQSRFLNRARDGPPLVLNGEVAALWGAGVGWPGFARVMAAGGRFVGLTEAEIGKVTNKHSFLKPMTVPAGSYEGQDEPVRTVGVWSFLMSSPDLKEETAYLIAKALGDGQELMSARLPQARETTLDNTRAAAERSDIHHGVLRYLDELRP